MNDVSKTKAVRGVARHPLMTLRAIRDFLKIDLTHHYKKRKRVFNQAGIMVAARIVAMGMAAVGQVWAVRCLGPRNLGISTMVQSIVVQAMLVIGLISPTVLVREYKYAEDPKSKNKIIQATNGFRLLVAILFCILAAFFMTFKWIPNEYHFAGWFFIPLFLLTSIQPAWIFQASEKQHFQSLIAVLQPTLTAVIYLTWFKPGMSAGDDLLVNSSVALILIIIYWRAIYKLTSLTGSFFRFDLLNDIKDLVIRSKWLFISSLAIYVYTVLEQPLLGWLYSVVELGKYRTAVLVTNAAQSLFMIVPSILYPRFIEWRKRGEVFFWRRQIKLAIIFMSFGSLMGLGAFIVIPFLYPFIFGPSFFQAAIPCSILVLSKLVVVVNGIFYWGLLTDHRYDRWASVSMISTGVISLTLNLIFIPKFGMMAAACVDLFSEVLILFFCFSFSFKRINYFKMKKLEKLGEF